jgi:lysophospholipase L1-like esterase
MKSRKNGCRGQKLRETRRSPRRTFFLVIGIVSILAAFTWATVQSAVLRVVIIGDSTAYTYTAADSLKGWGQELGYFFKAGAVTVINKSIGGRSSRSFIEDGHWETVKGLLKKGDYLLISFGTNDRGTVAERHTDTAGFRLYLTQYVTEARALGAIPILISTINQNSWNGSTFTEGFTVGANDYRGAMLRVVSALTAPFIDLEKKSAALFGSLGQSYCANFLFCGTTHFKEMGAVNVAKMVAEGIDELATDTVVNPLAAALALQYQVTINSNKPNAGAITRSATYPSGAPITVLAIPKSGETFQAWKDGSGKTVSPDTSYRFFMGSAPASYMAAFKGGATSVSIAKTPVPVSRQAPVITLSEAGMLAVISPEPILSVNITDISGRELRFFKPGCNRTILDMRSFARGRYFASARTAAAMTKQAIRY